MSNFEETSSNIVPLRSISFLPFLPKNRSVDGEIEENPEELRIEDIWFYDLPVVTVGYQDFIAFDEDNAPVNGSVNEIVKQFEGWSTQASEGLGLRVLQVQPDFVPGLGSIR